MPRFTSYSELNMWAGCHQKWHWHYEVNIEPARMQRLPTQGTLGHAGLAALLKGDDVLGAINKVYLDTLQTGEVYEDEDDLLKECVRKMLGVVLRYGQHYADDNFACVETEKQFEIPLNKLRVRLRGTWDALLTDQAGNYWLMETKFVDKQFRTREMLDLDGQIGTYQWAAQRIGIPVKGTIYNQILAQVPETPKINKDGSVSRAACMTDWPTYLRAVIDAGQNPADYEEMRDKLAERKWYQRDYLIRSPQEVARYARNMERVAYDCTSKHHHVYMCDDRIRCQMCPYRELCVETLKGGDVQFLIDNNFQPKQARYAEDEKEG